MNVTLRQLQVFDAVARHLSYTRAAEELHLTQPAVSMQIKQLEGSVGLPLFEQLGKRTYLTEAGRELHRYARAINGQLKEAEQVLEELQGLKRGRLAVTVASTVNYFATRLLAGFCKHYPGVRVNLDVTNREGLLRQLDANETDIVLMGQPPAGRDLISETFMANPLVVIATPGHRLAGRSQIPFEDLRDETFLMRERGSGTRSAMERHFAKHGVRFTSSMEMNTNEAVKQSVEAGLGLGIVSLHTVELEREVGRLITLDVETFPIMRRWYVVHRRDKRLSSVALAFKEFVLSQSGDDSAAERKPTPDGPKRRRKKATGNS